MLNDVSSGCSRSLAGSSERFRHATFSAPETFTFMSGRTSAEYELCPGNEVETAKAGRRRAMRRSASAENSCLILILKKRSQKALCRFLMSPATAMVAITSDSASWACS